MLKPVFLDRWGHVAPMPWSGRAHHVWKHFYSHVQRWDLLANVDLGQLLRASEECGCPRRLPFSEVPCAGERCLELLRQHHDEHYGPTYLDELGHKDTLSARQVGEDKQDSLLCCTPRGVLIAVSLSPPFSVRSAFRPNPPHDDSTGSDAGYYKKALRKWEKGVGMAVPGASKNQLLEELDAIAKAPVATTDDAWDLVWAIAYGRVLAPRSPDVAARLRSAEAHFESHRQQVIQLLQGKLRVEPLLSALEASLRDGDVDEARDVLLTLEDVLAVSEVLGFDAHVQRILAEVSRQVAPAPATLAGFAALARQRLDLAGTAAHTLWSTVDQAASRVPSHRLPAVLRGWLARLDEARTRLVHDVTQAIERFEVSTANVEPVRVLGSPSSEFDVHAKGLCPPAWHLRLFFVDTKHPKGEPLREGEDYQREDDGWTLNEEVWRLDGPEDEALLVAVAAPVLPEAASLEALLEAVASIPQARVTEVLLSPPSEQRP